MAVKSSGSNKESNAPFHVQTTGLYTCLAAVLALQKHWQSPWIGVCVYRVRTRRKDGGTGIRARVKRITTAYANHYTIPPVCTGRPRSGHTIRTILPRFWGRPGKKGIQTHACSAQRAPGSTYSACKCTLRVAARTLRAVNVL
jgi:hypothetical protein